jgi:hypothetical protein
MASEHLPEGKETVVTPLSRALPPETGSFASLPLDKFALYTRKTFP